MVSGARRAAAGARGYAVVVVLLLLLGLTALAHGALVLAERERLASTLEARLIARRLLARAGARAPAGADTLPTLGESVTVLAAGDRPPWHWSTEARRLGGDLVLLIGVGRVDPLSRPDRAAVVAAVLDPVAHVAALPAVVEAASVEGTASDVSSTRWLEPAEPAAGAACAPELRALDSVGARVPPPLVRAPSAPPGVSRVPDLGVLPGDSVLGRIGARLGAVVRPRPLVVAGACVEDAQNWGSPSDPAGACGGRMIVAAAEGPLRIEGGEGQGVLAAAGDVTLAEGARFDGLLLAGGDLIVEAGARLVGAARVGGALRLGGGRVEGSACAAARALRAALPLRSPYTLPDGVVIHPF